MTKKTSQFGRIIRKYRLVNAVTASFNNIMEQITEMIQ